MNRSREMSSLLEHKITGDQKNHKNRAYGREFAPTHMQGRFYGRDNSFYCSLDRTNGTIV